MADRPRCLGVLGGGGVSGMADSMEPCTMLWADHCCYGNDIWSRRGDPVAYRLVFSSICSCSFVCVSTRSFVFVRLCVNAIIPEPLEIGLSIITKMSRHNPMVERAVKFENGYIAVRGW